MKIIKKCILAAVVIAVCCGCWTYGSMRSVSTARAAVESITIEYQSDKILLPILHVAIGQSYRVEVFKHDDTTYQHPLPMDTAFTYIADKLGTYLLRYLVHDNGVETYVYKTMVLVDTIDPEFTLNLNASYQVGTKISLKPVIRDNTVHLCTVRYAMSMLDGTNVAVDETGSVVPTDNGEYRLVLTVTDAGGNETVKEFTFRVESDAQKKGCKSDLSEGGSTIALSAATLGITALLMVATRRKRKLCRKTDKGCGQHEN